MSLILRSGLQENHFFNLRVSLTTHEGLTGNYFYVTALGFQELVDKAWVRCS